MNGNAENIDQKQGSHHQLRPDHHHDDHHEDDQDGLMRIMMIPSSLSEADHKQGSHHQLCPDDHHHRVDEDDQYRFYHDYDEL